MMKFLLSFEELQALELRINALKLSRKSFESVLSGVSVHITVDTRLADLKTKQTHEHVFMNKVDAADSETIIDCIDTRIKELEAQFTEAKNAQKEINNNYLTLMKA